jgi:hypothetical protein
VKRWVPFALASAAVLLLLRCLEFRGSLIDDAYIVFRYADHLIAGHGPVFNVGERVEGFTSPLWLLLLAGARVCGLAYEDSVFLLGTAFAMATLAPTWALARRVAPEPAAIAAPLLLAAHPGFAMWAVHGLETSLFVFVTASAVWAAVRSWDDAGSGWDVLAGALCGVAFWTRPEGALWALALAIVPLVRKRARCVLTLLAVFAAFAIPLEAARLIYFGSLFPNTYYAKEGGGLGRLGFGISYAKTFVISHALVVAACVVGALPWWRSDRRDPFAPFACALGAAWTAYVVWMGGDAFPGYRFWLPVLPLAAALLAGALSRRETLALGSGLVVVAITAVAARADVRIEHETGRDFTAKMIAAGRWLKDNVPPGTVIAVNYVGALPYYAGLPTIDMLGLTDPAIARTPIQGHFRFPGHAKGNGASVLDRRPGLILMGGVSLGPEPVRELRTELASEDEIAADPRFAEQYELVNVPVTGPDGPAWFGFYRRKDVAWSSRGE